MRKKQKLTTGIAMAAEGLELAAALLSMIRGRTLTARKSAGKVVSSLREDATNVAERVANDVRKRLRPKPSAGARALQFAAGLGVGVGAALLFAPMPGARCEQTYTRR